MSQDVSLMVYGAFELFKQDPAKRRPIKCELRRRVEQNCNSSFITILTTLEIPPKYNIHNKNYET